ncbi:MAG: ribosome small subunit-dependent GTPase A [Spirochaetales bacterium]|jgi:ribosome biogenesis GTPase / thiamine phosphate phosphatase|nr:ribosome small subunit-dependent GTPase A [Spirochaetales bacterium]
MNINDYGWNRFVGSHPELTDRLATNTECRPARVVGESSQLYRLVSDAGENWAILTGSLLNSFTKKSDFPAVGDWLLADIKTDHEHWIIRETLPRYSALTRKIPGNVTEEQVLASNIDYVFLVNGLDGGRNFNLRGLERYITTAWESGAGPVVILNKADLCEDIEAAVLTAESVAAGAPVLATSALTGEGFPALQKYAVPGTTIVLVGRSGVGKSSIINQFAGSNLLDTGAQREQDLRGRHTTTHRELIRLSAGALIIDTPGLRELQLWGEENTLGATFPEIEALFGECRFRDCSHSNEPGCAVQQAVASGEIEQARFESYLGMQRELKYLKSKQDVQARKQKEARGKAIAKFSRQLKKTGKQYF